MKSKATPIVTNPIHKHTVKKLSIISIRTIIKHRRKIITQKMLSFDKNEVAFFNITSHPFCLYYNILECTQQQGKITKKLQLYYNVKIPPEKSQTVFLNLSGLFYKFLATVRTADFYFASVSWHSQSVMTLRTAVITVVFVLKLLKLFHNKSSPWC